VLWKRLYYVSLAELRGARRKRSTIGDTHDSKDRKHVASHEAIQQLLEAKLTRAGLDFDEFRPLLEQSELEARRTVANLVAEAERQSPERQERLHRTIEGLVARVERLQAMGASQASTSCWRRRPR
jgi:hypothetical protein